ncbi:Extended synaptotagmin-2 (E-Syt2) [Durusdinium trenchii]|uniref:Extended synaptotagmin-2 (E-Syt2) n=1 Tax=Durusdinium trenchii TaxID=1381693 RepID=A0ABP0K8Z6_9DINO
MKLGMQHLKLTGSLLLVFSPLLEKLPLVGGLSVTFPDIPEFSWTWTGSAGLGIRSIAATLDQVYVDIAQLAQERQLPKEERIENYRSPDPIGVLYITIWEARDLPAADISLRGSSSDPYVVVKVGNNSWQTIKRTRTLRPVWGPAHSMDFLVFHMEQHVCVDVFDSDMLSFDDLLGYVCTTNTRRPRISDVIPEVGEEDTREWDLHNKHGKLGGKLKMTCRFRELRDISERAFVEPQWLTCNNCQDPLQESKSLRACSLCGSRPSSQFLRCGSCFSANDARFECAKDNFRCCSQCWQERRPAAAMLRVCLREGLVPADDVLDGAGVALGVKVEGTTQWSAPGVRPTYDNMAEKSEAQRWIRNLCESFDKASVAKCLEISAEQATWGCGDPVTGLVFARTGLVFVLAVIWDHALHFLVRDPHEELQATVIYQGKSRTADQVPLFPKKVRESLRVSRGDRGAARADRRGLPMSEEPLEVTWTINLDSARTASIFADASVCQSLLTQLLPAETETSPELLGGLRAWRALVQAHAPPQLVCIGGYNSMWNRHEFVLQEGDARGCEDSSEVVCSLRGAEASDRWRCILPPMQQKRADVAVVGSSPKILFALGGRNGEQRHASVERLDLVQWQLHGQGWEMMPPMLQDRSGLAASVVAEGLVVAGGRSSLKGVLRDAEYCDLRHAGSFVPISPMHSPREYAAAAAVGDEFWVLGGGENCRSSSVEIWDAGASHWRPGPEMREKRYGASAVWHHGRLYVVGGSHHFRKRKLSVLESLDPREGLWECYDLQALDGPGYQSSLWGTGVAALDQSLYICGGAFRDLEESLTTVYRLDLRTMQLSRLNREAPGAACLLQVPRWYPSSS